MSLLEVVGLSHGFGDKVLYKNAGFTLNQGEHLGVVGQNGTGKSTLIGILTGEVIPDSGMVCWQPGVRLGYLDQYAEVEGEKSILEYLHTAFTGLYELEKEVTGLYERYSHEGRNEDLLRASAGQEKLEASGFYDIETRIERVSNGLGLSAVGMSRRLRELSGGQRAKAILAKLLLEGPDVLLLDEPTNFLDREHIDWLVEYLSSFPNAFITVSHDFRFLDRISTSICDVEAETIRKYHGKYSEYLRQKEHYRQEHLRQYQSQQLHIRRTEEYIRKNIAGVHSRNAKGRRKQLERLERIAAPSFTQKPSFSFEEVPASAQKALELTGLEIGYGGASLLTPLDLSVAGGEKLVITGFNGIGKSTLMKTLVGEIPAVAGEFHFSDSVRLGYYEQELNWENREETPLQILRDAYPKMTERQLRSKLAGCGVREDSVTQPVTSLSGGEQSKVKLCRLLLTPCNFLLLDEPTNHLDAETKEELVRALRAFGGNILLVSHEEGFYRDWVDTVIHIEQGEKLKIQKR